METIPFSLLVKDSLDAVVILDKQLLIVNYSTTFLNNFANKYEDIHGKQIIEVITTTPPQLVQELKEGLKGVVLLNPGIKHILPNGHTCWVKWKLQPLKDAMDIVKGVMLILEDITENKRNNDLLLRAEIVSRTGSWEVDLVQNKLFWSPMTRIIHEVEPDYIPTLEGGINFYKEGLYRNLISELVNDAMVEGTAWDTELIIVTKKGNEVWIRAKGEAEIVNGTCLRISGTFQDIDAKKKSELKYKETAERLKIATSNAKIGVWEYNVLNDQLLWDDNMYHLYGVSNTEFSGVYEAWQAAVHPDDKKRGMTEVEQAITGEKDFDTEFRVIWPNGAIKYIKAIARTERDPEGTAIKMIGTNWDITELKSTKLELERNQESFLDTFTNSSIGMALVGLDGKWIRINNGICTSLGYTEEELLKTTFKDITHPEDLDQGLMLMQEIVCGKRDSYQLEKKYFHKNGKLVYAIVTVTVVKDIHNQISHFIAQVLDITSRITAEKQLKSLLSVTKTQNESLLNFAHIVSHNLRSHSSNMSMLAKFLMEEENQKEQKNIHRMLIDATNGLSETIQHLNEVVQVKTDSSKNMKSINLLDYIINIENSIQGLLNTKEAKTLLKVSENHNVMAVPAYLESILLNLYTNALKYSSEKRKPILNISSTLTNDSLIVKFSDNGQGIDLKRHGNKLFGMYKTFHKHKEAKGIGLFITKNQIESMNGTITVESLPDIGTTFIITLKQG